MCSEWKDSFYAFRDWAIANGYEESLTIDRINNDKGYTPDNCRWTNKKVQSNNRRTNRYITINGITKTMMQWSEEYNIDYRRIQRRLLAGWTEIDAITKPIRPKKKSSENAQKKKSIK